MSTNDYDLIVIGEGATGMTAARLAADSGLRVASFEAVLFGGLVTNVTVLDPAPDPSAASGADYAASLYEAAVGAGVTSTMQPVVGVECLPAGFRVRTDDASFVTSQLVIASGARFRPLGVPGEADFVGRGISNCADCDGPLCRGAEAVVAGGGDSALQEALVLAEYCTRVHIVHHGATFTGRADLAARIAEHANITSIPNAEIERVEGVGGVERVIVRKLADDRRLTLECRAVFPYVGVIPNSEFLPAEFKRDDRGHLVTDNTFATSVPGAFAAGAVRAGFGGTLIDAIREGTAVVQTVVARAAT